MATSGSLSGTGVASGCTWSSGAAPWQFTPTTVQGVTANFNVANGCPQSDTGNATRSRLIVQWSAAKLAANDCDPDDAEAIVVTNAAISFYINTDGFDGNPRRCVIAGYALRTSVAGEHWNNAVSTGIDGDADPFVFDFPLTTNGAVSIDDSDAVTSKTLSALIQEQLRTDGVISLIFYIQNDTGSDDYAFILGGSNATTPYESSQGLSLKFDWELEEGPQLTMGSQKTYRSGSGASPIDATLTVTSTPNIQTAEIQIQAGEEGDSIAVGALPSGIVASELAGVITLTGPASAADFQTALRAMTFSSTAVPSDTLRIIRFFLTDVDDGTSGAVDFNVFVHSSTVAATLAVQSAVIGIEKLRGFFQAASTRPVDVALCDSSNGVQATYSGHTQGLTYAWARAFPCWGTGIAPMSNESNGWLAPVGDVQVGDVLGEGAVVGGEFDFSATPEDFQDRVWSPSTAGSGPDCADYVIPASPGGVVRDSDDTGLTNQLIIRSRHPLWFGGELVYGCRVFTPETDPCQFIYPSFMTGYATGAAAIAWPLTPLPISLPESGFGSVFVHCPAGYVVADSEVANNDGSAVRVAHSFYTGTPGDAEVRGEYGMLFQSLMDGSKTRGVRFSRFMVAGGQPTKTMTDELIDRSDEAIAEWFRFAADCQRTIARNSGLGPVVLIHINEGVNDSVDTGAGSTVYPRGGPESNDAVNDGDTVQGQINNRQSIINRLRDIWVTTCGFSESNLYFLLGGTHPMPSDPQRTFIEETLIEAIETLVEANSNVAGLNGFKLRVPDQLIATYGTTSFSATDEDSNTSYLMGRNERDYRIDSGGSLDPAHMTERGYIDYDMRLVGALMDAAFTAGILGTPNSGRASLLLY